MDIPFLHPKSKTFPDVNQAIAERDGLVAVGGDLSPERLLTAYRQGIFPWFSEGQPVCWWALSPRTVLYLTRLNGLGIIKADETAMNDLALNMWMVTKYWFDFDGSLRGRAKLTEDSKVRGIQRTLSLLRPYLLPEYLAEFDKTMKDLSLESECVKKSVIPS